MENQHLTTTLAIRNNTSNKHLYYKVTPFIMQFRVSRVRCYMVKPDRSYIKPGDSKVIDISIRKEVLEG